MYYSNYKIITRGRRVLTIFIASLLFLRIYTRIKRCPSIDSQYKAPISFASLREENCALKIIIIQEGEILN